MNAEQMNFSSLPTEPTQEMLEAGEMAMSAIPPHPHQDARDIWRAMVMAFRDEDGRST